jgi:hypothetical protein
MTSEIVFEESEVEPIIGSAPSAYDNTIVFEESEVEPIIASPPTRYDSTIVFEESEVEPIVGTAPSAYDGSTVFKPPGESGVTPAPSAYDGVIVFPESEGEVFTAPRARSPYEGTIAFSESEGEVFTAPRRPFAPRRQSTYDRAVVFDESEVEPIIGRVPRGYGGVISSQEIVFPEEEGEVFRAPTPPAIAPQSSLPLLGRGPIRRGVISWELLDAWDLPRPTAKLAGVSEAQLQVLSWLETHREKIIDVERRRHVDRRAIAAAIAWEALENTKWPFSARAVGVGKVHAKSSVVQQVEAAGYLPRRSDGAREFLLRNADDAIEYIGAIMQAQADIAKEFNYDIRRRPEILTNEYNGRDLRQWRERLSAKRPGSPLAPGNEMALWTQENLWYVELGVGTPDPAAFAIP